MAAMQWIGAFGTLLGLPAYERFAFDGREPAAGAYQRAPASGHSADGRPPAPTRWSAFRTGRGNGEEAAAACSA